MKCCICLRMLFCMTMPKCLHKCMTLQFVTSKCSLKVRFPQTSVEKEAWAVMRQSAFHWSVPAESFYIYVTITMKCCHLSISRDHRLFKSIFTNVIINSVSLLERGLGGGVGGCVSFFPLKAGLHYWLQKRKCNLVPILWLSVCKLSWFPSSVSAVRDLHSLVPHPQNVLEVNGSHGLMYLQMGIIVC